jgi:bacterioferritin-associated ferredoxin
VAVYACICHAVPVSAVAACIENGADDLATVGEATGAGTGCGGCLDRICELLRAARAERELQPAG